MNENSLPKLLTASVTTWRNVAHKKSHHFTKAPNCLCISVPLPRGADHTTQIRSQPGQRPGHRLVPRTGRTEKFCMHRLLCLITLVLTTSTLAFADMPIMKDELRPAPSQSAEPDSSKNDSGDAKQADPQQVPDISLELLCDTLA